MMPVILIANLLAANLGAQTPPPCVPPQDGVVYCPQNFYPRTGAVPSPAQRTKILEELGKALAAEITEKQADAAWKSADDEEARLAFAKARQAARTKKYAAFNAAMTEVVNGYGLRPPVTDFRQRQDPGLLPANRAIEEWRPHFSELQVWDSSTRKWRERQDGEDEAPHAVTGESGRISLFGDAFAEYVSKQKVALDPDEIAIKIYHETIHWVNAVSDAAKYPRGLPEIKRPWVMIFSKESEAHTLTATYAASLGNAAAASKSTAKAARFAELARAARILPPEKLLKAFPDVFESFRGGQPYAEDERPSEEDHLQEELDAIRRQEARVKTLIELRADIDLAQRLAQAACRGETVTPEDLAAFHVSDPVGLRPEIGDAPPDEEPTDCESAVLYDLRLFLSKGWATAEYVNEWAKHRREQGALKAMEDIAKECGFGFTRTRNTRRIVGFEELDSGGMSRYSFSISESTPWSPEIMVGALIVARACLRVTKFEANMSQPGWTPICSERGLSIMARHWADPQQDALLGKLSSSSSHPDNCVRDINYGLRRATAKEFRAAVDVAHKNYHKNVKRAEEIWRQNQALWERLRRRQERERRGDPPQNGGGDGGCANPNPDTGLVGCPP